MLQLAVNGRRRWPESIYLPAGVQAIAEDVLAGVSAGACSVHVHIYNAVGEETLDPVAVGMQLTAIRALVPGVPVGISTGEWIVPDIDKRLSYISRWEVLPDYVSVNFDEVGCEEVARAVLDKGIGIEAGIAGTLAARQLLASGLLPQCFRVLLEPEETTLPAAIRLVAELEELLLPLPGPGQVVLLHGFDHTCWPLLELAYSKGYQSRIGLEDTLSLPGGVLAGNADMIRLAKDIVQRKHRELQGL